MIGVTIGDIIGSRFEFLATGERDVQLFHPACTITDDTVCSAAVALATEHILNNIEFNHLLENKYQNAYPTDIAPKQLTFIDNKYITFIKDICKKYPMAGYGKFFMNWITEDNSKPYNSLGNGCLMRVSSIILQASSLEQAQFLAKHATEITHNHPDSLKSVEIYIDLLWLCKTHPNDNIVELKNNISTYLTNKNINFKNVEEYKAIGGFHVLAPDTLERVISCLMEASSFEESIKNALYIGSDTDTTGAIVGALSELVYGIPDSYLLELEKYYNYYNYEIIKALNKPYLNLDSNHFGELAKKNLLHHIDWHIKIDSNIPEDPTAAWDPLEEVELDEYYSETEKKMQYENDSFLGKILRRFHLKHNK